MEDGVTYRQSRIEIDGHCYHGGYRQISISQVMKVFPQAFEREGVLKLVYKFRPKFGDVLISPTSIKVRPKGPVCLVGYRNY